MVDAARVIHALPKMTWRGLLAPPYDDASFSFSHNQNEQAYPYIDRASHDHARMLPEQLTFRLYFLNTLETSAFPELWNSWWDKLKDGKPGMMEHPMLGAIDVVVNGGSVQLTAQTTAGVIATIQFSTTIEDPEQEQEFDDIVVSLQEASALADNDSAAVGVFPPSEADVTSLLDLAKQIESALFLAELEVAGLINLAKSVVDDMVKLVLETPLHTSYAAYDSLVAVYSIFADLGERVGENFARSTGTVITTKETTLDVFARERSNTLDDIISLNVGALATPSVPKGTMLKYYN